jgi:hypothetical protein
VSNRFRSPRRRNVRQRSGQKASGTVTGGECKILSAEKLVVGPDTSSMTFERKVKLPESFNQELRFAGFGGYLHPRDSLSVTGHLVFAETGGAVQDQPFTFEIEGGKWSKIGAHVLFREEGKDVEGVLTAQLRLRAPEAGEVDFFGFNLDAITFYSDRENLDELWMRFQQKTNIYLPEIYYFPLDQAFVVRPKQYSSLNFNPGRCILLKGCNRCARFLLVDASNELNGLSFSNHCISQAPCTHQLFSSYRVLENKCNTLPEEIRRIGRFESNLFSKSSLVGVQTYYGYQLECRACKKFFVNAPLNPMRNTSQHREDSLRRRALEVLVDTVLERPWIYHSFRLSNEGREFDKHIWERFDRKCFNCSKLLPSPSEMALDHTMPLVYLWPLDETATCLCATCNSKKSDSFPVDFYDKNQRERLSGITGIDMDTLNSRKVNSRAVDALRTKVLWFFDDFLGYPEYQEINEGKKAADLIYKSVKAALSTNGSRVDLVEEYRRVTERLPTTISTM